MATGSGKTLLMAAAILYYFHQGYKHFIFFVNQNNIVDKTQNNFINKFHTKYLFKNKIVINDKIVNLKEVDVFSDNPQGIEIKFTTIQKLYNDIHLEKENQTTLADLQKKNIVMLADEAHHLNANTRANSGFQEELIETGLTDRSSKVEVERKGWEHTVINLILNKNGQTKSKNVLLEFTATIPETEAITRKYQDKIIYKFALKEFLSAGYTKEINLISSTLDKKERILQALLFHWYRHKIAIKYGLPNFKPVILFRSKSIEESKEDYQFFINLVQDLSIDDFNFLNQIIDKFSKTTQPLLYEMGKSRTEQVLHFISKEKISIGEIVKFIKNNFTERQIIITNSKTNKTKTEKTTEDQNNLLNSLENKNNHIRAIFTVQRLTEGWDVLNLYDIVRLYEGRDEGADRMGNRRAGSSTIAEKQLIGRGVRYYPFSYQDKALNKRKFDNNLDHELRVLEELFFYSTSDHRYIDELKRELKKDGYIKDERVFKTFRLKEEFKNSKFYKTTKIWKNERIDNPNRRKKTLKDISIEYIKPYKTKDLLVTEEIVNFELEERPIRQNQPEENLTPNFSIKFKDIEKHIFLKAINIKAKEENSLFQFERLKKELEIKSIDDLQKPEFLGDFKVPIILTRNQKYEDVSNI